MRWWDGDTAARARCPKFGVHLPSALALLRAVARAAHQAPGKRPYPLPEIPLRAIQARLAAAAATSWIAMREPRSPWKAWSCRRVTEPAGNAQARISAAIHLDVLVSFCAGPATLPGCKTNPACAPPPRTSSSKPYRGVAPADAHVCGFCNGAAGVKTLVNASRRRARASVRGRRWSRHFMRSDRPSEPI